jgi:predicted aldo/keto reductase-like oxidoreductase
MVIRCYKPHRQGGILNGTACQRLHINETDVLFCTPGDQLHNPNMAQLEQITAPGGALEALLTAKASGKIRHIGITAHLLQVFEAALELDWVETVMFPYNLVEEQGEALMRICSQRNVGFICMKPLAGGAIEDATLALRFIAANPDVSVIIPGMAEDRELEQNLAAVNDTSPLRRDELEKLHTLRSQLGTQFCRRCNYCAPCTVGIAIPAVLVADTYFSRYGLQDWARSRYDAMEAKASDCVGCGVCESRCPYQLPIRQMLQDAAAHFEGLPK